MCPFENRFLRIFKYFFEILRPFSKNSQNRGMLCSKCLVNHFLPAKLFYKCWNLLPKCVFLVPFCSELLQFFPHVQFIKLNCLLLIFFQFFHLHVQFIQFWSLPINFFFNLGSFFLLALFALSLFFYSLIQVLVEKRKYFLFFWSVRLYLLTIVERVDNKMIILFLS